jgi:predicted amidohydrolase
MEHLRVSLVQTDLEWENKSANLKTISKLLESLKGLCDLVVLPEMFSTGFSMRPEKWAEQPEGESFEFLKHWAKTLHTAVAGSVITVEDQKFYNRAYFVKPDGTYFVYNKRHLFRMAGEHQHYAEGTEHQIFEYLGWKINLQVCYDLRFPVWSRNVNSAYDVLIYMANWPERRSNPWKILLRARAIENLAYVVGVNRIGKDGNGIEHSGDSALIDFKGDELSHIEAHKSHVETVTISRSDLLDFRQKFPAHLDADLFGVIKA